MPASAGHDLIDLSGRGLTFASLAVTPVVGGTTIGIPGGDAIFLSGAAASDASKVRLRFGLLQGEASFLAHSASAQSERRLAPSSQVWMICHLSRWHLVRKFKNAARASCSSKKNLNESRPVALPELIDCVWTHWSHSRMIRRFASSCFI
jgi:hypothetical protein